MLEKKPPMLWCISDTALWESCSGMLGMLALSLRVVSVQSEVLPDLPWQAVIG